MQQHTTTQSSLQLPTVSICTPTFNRRPFIPYIIKCVEAQTYPRHLIDWIIVDDGTDPVGDLVASLPYVKYFQVGQTNKLTLGAKRNFMNAKASGQIIVYMDDDDYYPPERISHAVQMLQNNPTALCAGSSEIHIYYPHLDKIYKFGPYGEKHSTAATFAFRRKLLKKTKFNENASIAEEKDFLKNYTIPFVQLDPKKTILVFSHIHNSFDKRKLLANPHPQFVKETNYNVSEYVADEQTRDFYMRGINDVLATYEPGRPNMKPDVIKQMVEIEKGRRELAILQQAEMQKQKNIPIITIQQKDGPPQQLTAEQVVNLLQQQQNRIIELTQLLAGKDMEIKVLTASLQTVDIA